MNLIPISLYASAIKLEQIERNPLRAKMVKDLKEYKFSSFNFYAYGEKDDIINTDPLYVELAQDLQIRMKLYREYVL